MIIDIFSELKKKYEKITEITMLCDGYVEVKIKSLLEELLVHIKEIEVLKTAFDYKQRERIKNRINIIIEFNEKIYSDVNVCVKGKCRKTQREVLRDMPCSGGVVIYEVCDNPEYIIVNWMGKGYFITCIGSDIFLIIARSMSDELLSMIKYFVTAPFVLSGEVHLVHGTSINFRGKNYLIAADSGMGKTSLGILFCLNGGFLISEDISYITKNGKIINLCSRNYFTLRKGTLHAFKDFFNDIYQEENLSQEELYLAGKESQQRISIDLLKLQGDKMNELGLIDCIIVPEISSQMIGYSIHKLDEKEIEKMNYVNNRNFMVYWLKMLLSFEINENFGKVYGSKKIKCIKLCTDFNYRSYFNEIINKL